jgi:hypothetical protein
MRSGLWFVTVLLGLVSPILRAVGPDDGRDWCEAATVAAARDLGWLAAREGDVQLSSDCRIGKTSLRVNGLASGLPYMGLRLKREIDLTGAGAGDHISFWIRQSYGTGVTINIKLQHAGHIYRSVSLPRNQWAQVVLDLDPAQWTREPGTDWGKIGQIAFYAKSFDAEQDFMQLDGLTITLAGNRVRPRQPTAWAMTDWTVPRVNGDTLYLGTKEAVWAFDRRTGRVAGGWNPKTKQRVLDGLVGRWHVDDPQTLVTGEETADRAVRGTHKANTAAFTCTNPALPGITIRKSYRLNGHRLFRRLAFTCEKSPRRFVTCNSEIAFAPGFREDAYYMGAGWIGPIVPAPDLTEWRQVNEYRNTSKGMILHRPTGQFSFAHVRLKLDDTFVWPWFSCAIAGYVERMNTLHYTPDGWDLSLGTSPLATGRDTSYEEMLSLFPGGWRDFLAKDYPALPEVRQAIGAIPPVPDWVGDVAASTGFKSMQRIKRLAEAMDEGHIMVLVSNWGNWADYRVRQGLNGANGGFIDGEELRDLVGRIKAISPRIKVGIYNLSLGTTYDSRVYEAHPEWFRTTNKDGEPVYFFPGMCPNYATLLSSEACYREVLQQFDEVLSWLGTDFIYLDEPRAVNMIDWQTGGYNRDDLCYRLFLDMKRIVAKHGPDKMLFFNARGNPYADVNFIEARGQIRPGFWRTMAGMNAGMEAFLDMAGTISPKRQGARIVPLYWTPPLARDYINRVLALGWIPSMTYGDIVERRPFLQAAYEMGDLAPGTSTYTPDWTNDPDTPVESYLMRRGDGTLVFSAILRAEEPQDIPVTIQLSESDLPESSLVHIWEHRIADAHEFKGRLTNATARKLYEETSRHPDRIANRRAGHTTLRTKELTFLARLVPNQLLQFVISQTPGAVYSVDGLPTQYLLPTMKGVRLKRKGRWGLVVQSEHEKVEVLLSNLDNVIKVDDKPVEPRWVRLLNRAFPLVTVPKGEHTITTHATEGSHWYSYSINEFRNDAGETPKPELPSEYAPRLDGHKRMVPVNRTIRDVNVLAAAEFTGHTAETGYQPGLPGLMAKVSLDTLAMEAGTTRKLDGFLGPAFAGFEIENLRRVELAVDNTFHDAFHLRGPGHHKPQYRTSKTSFAGVIVDYHTPKGYTCRVLYGMGVLEPDCTNTDPPFGKAGEADALRDLGDRLAKERSSTIRLDLQALAPKDWDGRVWLFAGSNYVAADRRLTARIAAVNDAVKGPFDQGRDPRDFRREFEKPKRAEIPRAPLAPIVDGEPDDEMWQAASVVDAFYLLGGKGLPRARTRAQFMYDDTYLYVAITCQEPVRRKPLIKNGAIWGDDEVEVWIDANGDGKTYRQIIVNGAGAKLEMGEDGTIEIGVRAAVHVREGHAWSAELAIPFAGLGVTPKPGATWRLNVARHRPAGNGFPTELLVWGPLSRGFKELPQFPTVTFR